MTKKFVIARNAGRRLMISCGLYRAEHLEDDPKSLKKCLTALGIKEDIKAQMELLEQAVERFYRLEARSLEKFGAPKVFRIWRVHAKTVQIDFKGGYAELTGSSKSDATLKRCLEDLGANALLLGDLKREWSEFLQNERAGD